MIIPVKASNAKSRLSPVLSPAERRSLVTALFRGLMDTLSKSGLVSTSYVVSSDGQILRLASALGARQVPETADSGVNAAVRAGMSAAKGSREFLVLPSDLPLLGARDLAALLGLRAEGARVVLAPSAAFDGTNALLFPRSPSFPLSFDRNSFWNHLAAASRLGFPTAVCARSGIMFDVDSPDDLRSLAASGVRGRGAAIARGAGR